jgi:hypothetical protein
VAVAPALLDPAELPEDATGRVALISVDAPDDIVGAPGPAPSAPAVASAPSALVAGDGWVIVAITGIVIVVIFVVGMLLTH